jgi:hypothetical protein
MCRRRKYIGALVLALTSAVTVAAQSAAQTSAAPMAAHREGEHVPAPWIQWPPALEVCRPAIGDARAALARARATIGIDTTDGHMLRRVRSHLVTVHNYESDRTYRPFLTMVTDEESLLDPRTAVRRDSTVIAFDGFGAGPAAVSLQVSTPRSVFVRRDSAWVSSNDAWGSAQSSRALDPWATLLAWSAAPDAQVTARCRYRDYDRTVIERQGIFGRERLYIDPKSGFLVKLERDEPHYLWGQQHVEYVYTTWLRFGGPVMPSSTARLVDGDEESSREVTAAEWVARTASPSVTIPDTAATNTVTAPMFLRYAPLDTMRLGPQLFALRNRGYNEIVALSHDTVFVVEATQSEERARADSAWIGRLFPGRHAVMVVVTDLAWPHVSGVRFWVASGATIISRDRSESFLRIVADRRWTRQPDKLERERAHASLHFVPVRDSLRIGGLTIYPIDGIASEGAVMVYVPAERFLWASDYVQDTKSPTLYASEVYRAACRVGISPTHGAAQHVPPFDWATIVQLAAQMRLGETSACN